MRSGMTDEVTIDGDTLRPLSRGCLLDAQHRNALDRVYFVEAGSDISVYNLNVEFHVFRFAGKLWVLPEKTAGVSTVIDGVWRKDITPSDRCWDAFLGEIPRAWRKSFLWRLVGPHAPGLLVLPVEALPTWRIRRKGSKGSYVGEHDYPFPDALIGGWFHQDFDIAGNTLEEVITSYKKVDAPEDLADARAEIERLLGRCDDQELTREVIRLFEPGVDPEAWGMSTRQWLMRIHALLG
jgi:contact-dependent growth inhibition (CDI) system CdiI-like immunity protein